MLPNRSQPVRASRIGPGMPWLLLLLLGSVAGVGYVGEKYTVYTLGQDKKRYENLLDDACHKTARLRVELDTMQVPRTLESRIKELNLGLVQPQPEQILRLVEPTAGGTAGRSGTEPFVNQGAGAQPPRPQAPASYALAPAMRSSLPR